MCVCVYARARRNATRFASAHSIETAINAEVAKPVTNKRKTKRKQVLSCLHPVRVSLRKKKKIQYTKKKNRLTENGRINANAKRFEELLFKDRIYNFCQNEKQKSKRSRSGFPVSNFSGNFKHVVCNALPLALPSRGECACARVCVWGFAAWFPKQTCRLFGHLLSFRYIHFFFFSFFHLLVARNYGNAFKSHSSVTFAFSLLLQFFLVLALQLSYFGA